MSIFFYTEYINSTAGKIYTPIFLFFRKRVVNTAILELGPVSNERPGIFTLQYGEAKITIFIT